MNRVRDSVPDLDAFHRPGGTRLHPSDQDGREFTLSGQRNLGLPVVVYSYPKADTPGCTI